MLVTKINRYIPIALLAATAVVGLQRPAFAQATPAPQAAGAQPQWKDRAEYDLYDSIQKEQDATKRLALLNQWKEKYATTEYLNVRLLYYVVTYQQMPGKEAEVIEAANDLLAKDPNNVRPLSAIITAIYNVKNPTPDQLGSAEKAATQILSSIDTLKPAGVADDAWEKGKPQLLTLAQNTLGYVAQQRKDWPKAEAEFTKSLKTDPNQGVISYWRGSAALAQKDPAKQSAALWDFAHATALNYPPAKDFLTKAYTSYHGSPEGLDQLIQQAKSAAFPPAPDWKVKSKSDILQDEQAKQDAIAKANPSLALWKSIKTALTEANGASYFDTSMKGAGLPGGAGGVEKFVGKLISATPEGKPKELVLAIEDGKTPDVTLKLDTPLAGKMEPGADIGFEGVATSYTASPFMVNFDVEKAKLTGWKGVGAAPVSKAAPARRTGGAKKR